MTTTQNSAESCGWVDACDQEMTSAHLGVANFNDSFKDAKNKLGMLIDWHVDVATDPAVNGGYSLKSELTDNDIIDVMNEIWSTPYAHTAGWTKDHVSFARALFAKQRSIV